LRNNAEVVVDALERAGIEYVFGYPGGQNARFIEAMHGSRVRFVLVTHESCAGFMADVCGRLTGKPGACLSTLGPGATNMTTGVGNAYLDRVPMLAFTGKMGRRWQGRTVQMQVDHRQLYAPITKWSTELTGGSIYPTIARAVEVALAEQPGPVHLDFPEDVAEELSEEAPRGFAPVPPRLPPCDEGALRAAEALIRRADRPLVAVGLTMNRAGATAELERFIVRNHFPVVSTMMAKGQVDHGPLPFVGVVGRARHDLIADYCRPADLVIAVGYDPVEFNYEEWVRRGLPIVHIDTVPADIAPGHAPVCQLVGDVRSTLSRLGDLAGLRHRWDLATLGEHREGLLRALTPACDGFAPHQAVQALRDVLPPDGLITVDVGAHTHLIAQLWPTGGPRNLLVSNGWSSMGFAIPAAIAARLVEPDRPVVACTGDGGYLMMVGEISTAVRLGLPVVFVVLRDRFLSLIRVKQRRRSFHEDAVELFGDSYAPSDRLFGARVEVATSEEQFREVLRTGLAGTGPLVIEAVVDPSEYDSVL
jgi:acetolactate synthase I/II/III large subunit